MTITESELREILNEAGSEGEGHKRGVTVADVHRRVRVIRRRRRWAATGGVAVLGLAAVLVSSPSARDTWMPEDVWTGVMARPERTPQTVSGPVEEEPVMRERVASSRLYKEGGVREEFAFTMTAPHVRVVMECRGTPDRAALWIDGRLVTAGPCDDGEDDDTWTPLFWDFEGEPGSRHTIAGIVLKAEVTNPEDLTGTADVDHLVERQRPFSAEWRVEVIRLEDPKCLDEVRQLDPRTGEMVRMECGDEGTAPSGGS